jgi:hypothetical protein
MKKYKTQFARITDIFVSVTVVITAAVLVASGMAVTKINTEYMETGESVAKIVSERESTEIFFSLNGREFAPPESVGQYFESLKYFLPTPLNIVFYFADKFSM